jgi:glycosyltransferase involved in cell wall biosynthesis
MIVTSVVIPSYQGAERLETLLGCLALQETDFEWEAVVVLDGSTDDSLGTITRWSSSVPVRVIDLGTNRGRSAALNAGFDAAMGRVLVRCDDDLAPAPDYVRRHTEHHEGRDDLGVIGLCPNIFPETTYARVYGRHADLLARQAAYADPTNRPWRRWAASCSVTRPMFDAVGAYDTAFRAYGWEDVDWGFRLHLAAATFVLDHGLEAGHLGAPATTRIRCDRAFLSGMARQKFITKHSIADEPETPRSVRENLWNIAVWLMARCPRPARTFYAGMIDQTGDRLPTALGRKLIALAVESSGRAGSRAAHRRNPSLRQDRT